MHMAQQRRSAQQRGGTGGDAGGGRERGTRSSDRGRRDLSEQELQQRDLRGSRGGANLGDIDRAIRQTRERSIDEKEGRRGTEDGA